METIYTTQEVLTMLEYQTTKDFIELEISTQNDLNNKLDIEQRCNLNINILSYLKQIDKTVLWNNYVEKAELIVNSEIT